MNNVFDIESFTGNENLFIAASAGTGKTYTIQQVVGKLVTQGMNLNQILIVTYTEKAAGELKDRIRKKIEEEFKKDSGNIYLQQALHDVQGAPIGTIHSFCQKVTQEFAYEADVPLKQELIDESAVEELIQKSIRDVWAHEELFKCFVKYNGDLDSFTELLKGAIASYIPETVRFAGNMELRLGTKDIDFDDVGCMAEAEDFTHLREIPCVDAACDILKIHQDELISKSKTAGDLLKAVSSWTKGFALYNGASFKFNVVGDGSELDSALGVIKDLKALLDEKSGGIETLLLHKCLYEYTPRLFDAWQLHKNTSKIQSFNDMIRNVYKAVLDDDSPLVDSLRQKYLFAIIDEFQDTNLLQWEIFKRVFFDADDGLHHILVVGDPKQSIYSFQGANVKVYENAVDQIANGKVLSTNWRSSKAMIEACNELFPPFGFEFESSKSPTDAKKDATYKGKVIKPFLVSKPNVDPKDYAEIVVNNIVDLCSFKGGKTNLQIPDKETGELRNVRFSDFAVLARTRNELDNIEYGMKKAGIPFLRYMDANLFRSRECAEWTALFRAIDAEDYSDRNRSLLYAALMTDFFGKDMDYINAFKPDEDGAQFITIFSQWHALAEQRRWAELQECIYSDASNLVSLNAPDQLQSLNKIRQVGDYAIEYLYTANASLEELIRHLDGLAIGSEDALENSNIVAKGTDLDVVQTMTIHASKGLEFPVVISVASERGHVGSSGPYVFNNPSGDLSRVMTFEKGGKEICQQETEEEWRRLFYVAFTRASYLMILPWFPKFKPDKSGKMRARCKAMDWYVDILEGFCKKAENAKFFDFVEDKKFKDRKESVRTILKLMQKDSETVSAASIESAAQTLKSLDVWRKFPHSTSYSQIAHGTQEQETDEGRLQKDEVDSTKAKTENEAPTAEDKYPRGAELGNAIHKIFELVDFEEVGKLALAEALEFKPLQELVRKSFVDENLDIEHHPQWLARTVEMVWHTLNGKLETIEGAQKTGESFTLNEVSFANRRSELPFHMALDGVKGTELLDRYCKGFIDLLFVRDGRYCILDWKSDVLGDYGNESMKEHMVFRHYDVQQILYSYVLIRWLKGFYRDLTEQQIFEKYFGGIYYVFFRGCSEGETSGIMSSTFASYEELNKLYSGII